MTTLDPAMLATLLRESLAQGHQPTMIVSSNSMLPLLRQGDEVTIEAITAAQLRPGDVVTCINQGHLLTHRFWTMTCENNTETIMTRGDRPFQFDPPVPPDALIGRVIGRQRRNHYLSITKGAGRWLNQHLAFLAAAEWRRLRQAQAGEAPPFSWRLARRLLLMWGTVLTRTITLLANR